MNSEQYIDTTNFELNLAEYVQAIRDRRILGLSAIACYLEEQFQPKHANFIRARWGRIKNIVPKDATARNSGLRVAWKTIEPLSDAARISKNKDTAVILGTMSNIEDEMWEHERYQRLPAVAFAYRGVLRAGIVPDGFGQLDKYSNAVAMLIGKSQFDATMGTLLIRKRGAKVSSYVSRKDIRRSTLFIPDDVEVVDIVNANELPQSIPLV